MNKDTVEVQAKSGGRVEITLEDWVERIIDKSLEKHKTHCLFDSEKCGDRIYKLEWQMSVVKWVGLTVSSAAIAHIVYTLISVIEH